MAALLAILNSLRRSVQRDLGTFEAVKLNNIFLLAALMAYGALNAGVEPKSAEPLLLLLGLLVLFPLSSDPLGRIPPSRLGFWPLSRKQKMALRLTSFLLSPVVWIAVFLMILRKGFSAALLFLGVAIAAQILVVLSHRAAKADPHWNLLRHIPQFPGRFGGMIRNNIRELLSILDTYVAIAISIGGIAMRVLSLNPDPAGPAVLAVLVALALSTWAQSLFGLDSRSGLTRYRLLPLKGWEILLSKDCAFLTVLAILILPLNLWSGLTAGFVALALGHHSSVLMRLPQRRWRFTGGRLLPVGALQAIGCFALGIVEAKTGPVLLVLSAIGYAGSVWWYGRLWDRQSLRKRPHEASLTPYSAR
ncbi:MAG TPA: hypothetical protein VG273_17625 [Bryobacteraceae bacterium]|nr:hypothetical protein [Bryobacteraceae bacterium]